MERKSVQGNKKIIPHTHSSVASVLFCLSDSPSAAAPSVPILLLLRLCSGRKSRLGTGAAERKSVPVKKFLPQPHFSVVSVSFCLSISPIAAAPSAPMAFQQILCSGTKTQTGLSQKRGTYTGKKVAFSPTYLL